MILDGTLTAKSLRIYSNSDFRFLPGSTINITGGVGLGTGWLGPNFSLEPNRTINVTNTTTITHSSSFTLDGGTLNTSSVVVQVLGTFNFSSGTLGITGPAGNLLNDGDLVVINTAIDAPVVNNNAVTVVGTVDFNGLVSGPGDFFGPGTAHFNGGLAPGASPAEVSFEGSLALADANTLFIEIGGITPGSQYDRLTIAGNASLDGILNVSLINGFTPTGGQQFTILTAGSIVNNGFVLAGPAASSFNLLVNSTSVILQAIGGPARRLQPRRHSRRGRLRVLAQNGGPLQNEVDNPGTVNAGDYTAWRARFRQLCRQRRGCQVRMPPSPNRQRW